ncbi:MAG: amidohydrolase family protein [Acidobacteriaceae bacterium]|nr:amidohydrolase family protein [Acidobacteriaceae bacterium]MBV9778363.1 amidohydrolase family protein [Acidobacteriaceae bacterium]
MRFCILVALALVLLPYSAIAQTPGLSTTVEQFVRVHAKTVILTHVRIIDGTGAPAVEDQNVAIRDGKINAVEPGADVVAAQGETVLPLRGYTVMPGIVGMHNHLFYIARPNLDVRRHSDPPVIVLQMTFSAPRLYLAGGVTTMRTTGSVETYADLNLKHDIDAGKLPGPHIDVTGPYLEGSTSIFIQMPHLTSPADARETVEYWIKQGVTSFKAYMNITRAELKAAIDAAHQHGLKVTGHLCSVTYKEAAELGIDDLEHGFFVNTQLDHDKKPDVCSQSAGTETLARMDPGGLEAKELINTLISHHVAITSTLPVFENFAGAGRPQVRQQALEAMSPQAREDFFLLRQPRSPLSAEKIDPAMLWQHDLGLERAFVAAGGLLLSGPDPTGRGDVLSGFGDQRGIELLVEAGFTPVEALKIATLNGAIYLRREKEIGSVRAGENADLVVIKGDPSKQISDIENVELVFKDGIGYDSQKLLDSVKGKYGRY